MLALVVVQQLQRPTERARALRRGAFDRGSTLLVGVALGVGLLLPLIMDGLGVAVFAIGMIEGLVALVVMVLGLELRVWSAATLGRYYTRTLTVTEDHRVITAGPYARVRHPGYLGTVLMWSGFGVVSSSFVVAFLFPVLFLVVYLYRISVEEKMMVEELGEDYVQYQRRSRKLVPFVY